MRGIKDPVSPTVGAGLVRSGMLALVVACLSLAGHASARGTLPGPLGMGIVLLVTAGLTVAATSRVRSFPWLVGFLVGTSLLMHVLLVLASPHGHGSMAMPLVPSGDMAIAHVLAALVAAAVLARGEQTLAAWDRLLRSCLMWRLPIITVTGTALSRPIDGELWHPRRRDLTLAVRRRGPPSLRSAP